MSSAGSHYVWKRRPICFEVEWEFDFQVMLKSRHHVEPSQNKTRQESSRKERKKKKPHESSVIQTPKIEPGNPALCTLHFR
jgi:hypothetical protein